MKFTFKTTKATGRYRSFFTDHHDIKFNKFECGCIEDKNPHKIRLKVIKKDINEDGNPNCKWKWIILKGEFESVQTAKNSLNENIDKIFELHNIYTGEKWKKI